MATILRARPEPAGRDTSDDDPTPQGGPTPRGHGLSLSGLVALVVIVAGCLIGLQPLSDNSFFTHLATGRLILESGVPVADPYSFTAPGTEWTVQSWLASALYAGAEQLGGLAGVRVLMALLTGVLAYLLWRLTEPAGALVARAALILPAILIGTEAWAERPMLFGFIGLAAVLLLADGHGRAWWAVPLFWVWVNTHGSFPMGIVLLGTLVVGRWLDRQAPRRELQVLGWAGAGVLLGAVNPLGPRLLVFPVELLAKADTLSFIDEWRPPDYGDLAPRILVLQVGLAVVLVAWRHRRLRSALPLVVFTVLALTSARNVAPAAIVVLAVTAPALRGVGTDIGAIRRCSFTLAGAAIVVLAALIGVSSLRGTATDLAFYPTDAVDWMEDNDLTGPDARIISRDYVGNYLEARYGTAMPVFIDDRYDMFPVEVIDDYRALYRGDERWEQIAARWDADAILWTKDTDLGDLLEEARGWRTAFEDEHWVLVLPA